MLIDLWVRLFVNRLGVEDCIKLYAGLLMISDKNISRKEALSKAHLSNRNQLKYKLIELINYGPN